MRLARILKFRLYQVEVLYYPGSEQQRCWSDCARRCAGWSAPLLFAYVINRFSHDMAHLVYMCHISFTVLVLVVRRLEIPIHVLQWHCWAQVPDAAHPAPKSLALWFRRRRFLKVFLPYMGVAAILVMWPRHPHKVSFPRPMEAPHEIWLWLAQWFLEKMFENVDGRRMPAYTIKLTYEPLAQVRWAKNHTSPQNLAASLDVVLVLV